MLILIKDLERRQSYGRDLTSNLFLIVFLIIIAAEAIKILREYERGVIFRLGRLIGAKGPGLIFIIPGVQVAPDQPEDSGAGDSTSGCDHP